jgi:hypothetical protein
VYLVAKAEQERQAAVIRAEGEAEAAELISAALKGSGVGLIEVRVCVFQQYACTFISHRLCSTFLCNVMFSALHSARSSAVACSQGQSLYIDCIS